MRAGVAAGNRASDRPGARGLLKVTMTYYNENDPKAAAQVIRAYDDLSR
jgi:hypothetical protein